MLPIVLYHGTVPWWAEEDVAGLCVPTSKEFTSYQPSQRYFLLELAAYTDALCETAAGENRDSPG